MKTNTTWNLETTISNFNAWIAIPRGQKHTPAQIAALENRFGFTLADLKENYDRLILSQP